VGGAAAEKERASMPITYRLRSFDETSVIAGRYSHCEDDGAAEWYADLPAVKSRRYNIVIWDDDRQVLREPDPSPDTPPSSLGQPASSELIRRAEEAIARSRELRDEMLLVLARSRAIHGRSVALMSTPLGKPTPPATE